MASNMMTENITDQHEETDDQNDNKNRISITDIDLEPPGPSDRVSLGLEARNAAEGVGFGDLDFDGKASVDSVLEEITYGTFKGLPACCVIITVWILSHRDFRIEEVTLHYTAGDASSEALMKASGGSFLTSDVVRPKMLHLAPRRLDDPHPTAVGIKKS